EVLVVVLPQVRDDLGVGVGDKPMSAAGKLGPALGVVEQLAVEDHLDGAVLVADRLATVEQPDNAESPGGEAQTGALQATVLVGPTVDDRVGHCVQDAGRHGSSLARKIDYPRDPTHAAPPCAGVESFSSAGPSSLLLSLFISAMTPFVQPPYRPAR